MRRALAFLAIGLMGCAGRAAQPARGPEAGPAPPPAAESPPPGAEPPGVTPASVPPPPAECTAYAERKAAPLCPTAEPQLYEALAEALALDAAARDEKLVALEGCASFPPGLIGTLRADLAPRGCGDAVAGVVAQHAGQKAAPELRSALAGITLGAKLSRLVAEPPRLQPPFDKASFTQFMQSTLSPWISGQAQAIYLLSVDGAKLSGYGKAIAAVEAGLADMRFVEVVRDVPLPEDMAQKSDIRDVYYGALDQALDPRKDRGRDAALAGLRLFAEEGVLRDLRVERARALLSKLYAGRRIDALDGLLLPPLPAFNPGTPLERVASRLPAFYAGFVLSAEDPSQPKLLRALLERGIPRAMRAHLDSAKLPPPARELYARGLIELGKLYWRSHDFQRAAAVAPESPLIAALGAALEGGPKDAAHMMLRGPVLPAGVGNVKRLDELAATRGPLSGLAAYDAAHILALTPPVEQNPAYFEDLAKRFRAAEKLLKDPKQRARARERAEAAEQTAKAVRG